MRNFTYYIIIMMEKVVKLLQEIMNQIVAAEEQAQSIRSGALAESKAAQAEAARQGRLLVENARKRGTETARSLLEEAEADARLIAQNAQAKAAEKADALRERNEKSVDSAARFVMERIVNSV